MKRAKALAGTRRGEEGRERRRSEKADAQNLVGILSPAITPNKFRKELWKMSWKIIFPSLSEYSNLNVKTRASI